MKYLVLCFFGSLLLCVNNVEGGQYKSVTNASINGWNIEKLTGVTPEDCENACNRISWCKSFDYYKGKNKCDLSNKNKHDVGLKTRNSPYTYYEKPLRIKPAYIYTWDAAITGHNYLKLTGVSVRDCKKACSRKSWCKSFDYHKGKNKCDLSRKNQFDIRRGLTRNAYRYDHYQKR